MSQQFSEYSSYDAVGLAELIKTGNISSQEVLEAAILQIETHNPTLKAVNFSLFDKARANLEKVDSSLPFAGVPTLLKDIQHHLKGTPLSEGSRAFTTRVSDHDSFLAQAFKQQGFIICGKSSTPEFALKGITEPLAFGPTRNPWNPNHSPGGSSGGAASAVASRMVPIASASDGGGSIRIPAAYCGLVGLKPSRARVSSGPAFADLWAGFSSSLVVSRTLRDSAAALDFLSGAQSGDPYGVIESNKPKESYLADSKLPCRKLKIAFCTDSPLGSEVDADAIKAIQETVELLEANGHICEQAKPKIDGQQVAEGFFTIYYAYMSAKVQSVINEHGKKRARDLLELDTQVLACIGNAINAGEFVAKRDEWNKITRTMANFLDVKNGGYDLYLTPTAAQKPWEIGGMGLGTIEEAAAKLITRFDLGKVLIASGIVKKHASNALARTPFTQLANMTGLPGISVPVFHSDEDLPFGSQFVAPAGDELTLLQLANELEQQVNWQERKPSMLK
jgi:amidase